jgi:hypothetical protein
MSPVKGKSNPKYVGSIDRGEKQSLSKKIKRSSTLKTLAGGLWEE